MEEFGGDYSSWYYYSDSTVVSCRSSLHFWGIALVSVPPLRNLRPEIPPQRNLRPEIPPLRNLRPEIPPLRKMRPEIPQKNLKNGKYIYFPFFRFFCGISGRIFRNGGISGRKFRNGGISGRKFRCGGISGRKFRNGGTETRAIPQKCREDLQETTVESE